MKYNSTKRFGAIALILCAVLLPLRAASLDDLLAGFAAEDVALKELHIKFMHSLLEEKRVLIDRGINVALSTGTMNFTAGKGASVFSLAPEIKLSLPSFRNTRISASMPLTIKSVHGNPPSGAADGKKAVFDALFNVKTDIISFEHNRHKLILEKTTRQTELARRAYEDRIIETEKKFWSELQALYLLAASAAKAQDDLISSQKDFETVKAQGYGMFSPKYRKAELNVKSDEHTLEEKKRLFDSALADFSLNCGKEAGFLSEAPVLPDNLKNRPLLSVNDFAGTLTSPVEQAAWNYSYNERLRGAQKNFFLEAGLSYAYASHDAGAGGIGGGTSGTASSSKIGGELSASWKGVSATAGASFTAEKPLQPVLSFALGWDMNVFKNAALTVQEKAFGREADILALKAAEKDEKKRVQAFSVRAADLEWQRKKNADELDLYRSLYADSEKWFKEGFISELDLLEAKANFEQIRYKAGSTDVDCLIYNLDVQRLFIRDGRR